MAQTTSSQALYNFRLLSVLRSDDASQIQAFIAESEGDPARSGALLGTAVKVGTIPIINAILARPNVDVNAPVDPNGKSSPLHIAAESGRADAAAVLLAQPHINDTLRDEQGRTPLECSATQEVAAVIEGMSADPESASGPAYGGIWSRLQGRYAEILASYISSTTSSQDESHVMHALLESPRAEILNLNILDVKSGTSLLHEAARRRDQQLVEQAVKKGADVFLRDKKGKRVLEGEKHPDEKIKAFLRQFSNQESLVHPKSDGRPPDLKGFMSKWTNYRNGWRTRWFVLEGGVLSYYRQREDEPVACRGSISMAVAVVTPTNDNSRFELHSKVSSSVPKIICKSSHRGEIARWVQAIRMNIEYYSKPGRAMSSSSAHAGAQMSSSASAMHIAAPSSVVGSLPPTDSFLSQALQRTATSLSTGSTSRPGVDHGIGRGQVDNDAISIFDAADDQSIAEGADHMSAGIPHEGLFDINVLNIKTQLELTEQLISAMVATPASGAGSAKTPSSNGQEALKDALRTSLATLATLISQQKLMTQDRERYLLGRIDREVEARRLWEENMLTVAKQQAETDRQLNEAAKQNDKQRKMLRQAKEVLGNIASSGSLPTSPAAEEAYSTSPLDSLHSSIGAFAATPASQAPTFRTARSGRQSISISNVQQVAAALDADGDSDDEEDEFFDAIETGALPNLTKHASIANPDGDRPGTPSAVERKVELAVQTADKGTVKEYLARKSLEPYLHVRSKLPIDDDKRPSVSLWSILKGSVGKDLTKISFPVSFNECTSMLQRMAEDMEYDACLTVAAGEQDSLKRIAFVSAFAMSNYSSTIGRIAKPFNPLLSQTFEYAIPNRYRYVSEQVSHHPPISACYSEAPSWRYYGEVDAQNKFQGRSFEIRPTGMAHADLIIPKAWVGGAKYPDAGPEYGEGLVVEHYSWKKVTTNVSGFITGSPVIDHYGDLVVTTLTFKPRTWRGKDAFEIKGEVLNAQGRRAWDIAGRWDTQLIARKAESSAPLEVDTQISAAQKEYLLLWKNSEKPVEPFNLTPFAITLNDIPQGLRPYLCPTDCRLRTDQRAFENAEYDRAQDLKIANEEIQRNTRKLRAEGRLPAHEPRWFDASTDPDSGERVWVPKRYQDGAEAGKGEVLFWHERESAPTTRWPEVEHIFAEDQR